MARPRLWVSVAVAAAAVAIAGCYGSTEPATNITFDGATLNARGTTNNGQAESWFEFWQTSSNPPHLQLGHQTWPAGVSGPFSHTQSGLVPNTNYSFRLCGNDVGGDPVCAQTRTFTTADGDTAAGAFAYSDGRSAGFDASSGPRGERPRGSILSCISSNCHRTDLDCFKVSGSRAILGNDDNLFEVRDGNPDTIAYPPSGTFPTCATASFDGFVVDSAATVNATVHDAP
jgi:hypothetical protein